MNMYKLTVFWLPQNLNAYCSELDIMYTHHSIPDTLRKYYQAGKVCL